MAVPTTKAEFTKKCLCRLGKPGLSSLSPDELDSLDDEQKHQLEEIVDKINMIEQII